MAGLTQIESISIKNYRCFRDVALNDLPRMTVVVGANGSGKSTLFDVFTFLKDALAQNVASAVARRGGYRELVSRDQEGPIKITVKFRESGGRLATYRLEVGAQNDGRAVVDREALSYRIGKNGRPRRFVDFMQGSGKAITNESMHCADDAAEERAEYVLDDPSILAIKGLGQFRGFRVVSELRSLIENWHISDIHIDEARTSAGAGHAERLSPRGDNLAQVAQYLYKNHPERFDKILQFMRWYIPGMKGVEVKPTEGGRLVIRFQDSSFNDTFTAQHVSDGTLKMFAYLALLNDPKPHPLLTVEEPESHIHLRLMPEMVEMFRLYAWRGGQVFLSTQSTDLLNWVKLEELFCLIKKDSFTSVHRASDSKTLQAFIRGGDLPGVLLRQGFFEEKPPP